MDNSTEEKSELKSEKAKNINNYRPASNFIDRIFGDRDTVLILALILLLYSDKGDKLLILALVYIIS